MAALQKPTVLLVPASKTSTLFGIAICCQVSISIKFRDNALLDISGRRVGLDGLDVLKAQGRNSSLA